jgi:hypothetical protein
MVSLNLMDKGTLKWLVLAAIAVCGMLGWKVATQASKDGKKEVAAVERPEPRFGVVTAILYCDDSPSVMIEDQMLHEGDVIHDVRVLDIKTDRVQFEKQGDQWEQGVQESAKPEWWKRNKGKESST